MRMFFIFLLNLLFVYGICYGFIFLFNVVKKYHTKKHADNRPFIKYLIDFRAKIKVGDLVKSNAPNFKMKEVMVVLEENIDGPDFSGNIGPGFIVLYNNRRTFISERDCYKVTIVDQG